MIVKGKSCKMSAKRALLMSVYALESAIETDPTFCNSKEGPAAVKAARDFIRAQWPPPPVASKDPRRTNYHVNELDAF